MNTVRECSTSASLRCTSTIFSALNGAARGKLEDEGEGNIVSRAISPNPFMEFVGNSLDMDRPRTPLDFSVGDHNLLPGIGQVAKSDTKLVHIYAKCGRLRNARSIFNKMRKRNLQLWTAMIGAYARHGKPDEALKLYTQMQRQGMRPDEFVLPCVLEACARLVALQWGKEIHGYVIKCRFESDAFVGNALIDMYGECGVLQHARQVFDRMPERNVASWNAMIVGYAQMGHSDDASKLFHRMQMTSISPDVISWNAMLVGYVKSGDHNEALRLFHQMHLAGVQPTSVTASTILPACAHLAALQQGKEIHAYIIRTGRETDVFVGSALIDMYAKCWSIKDACLMFEKMYQRNVVSWNAMIAGYVQNGNGHLGLKLFDEMQLSSVKPNSVTIASVLSACAHTTALQQGKRIHEYIIRNSIEPNVFVGSALVDMYAKCGNIEEARQVFDKMSQRNLVTWNAMIVGYAQNGHGDKALKLFHEMQLIGMKPDSITVVGLLPACAQMTALQQGKEIHGYIIRSGFESNVFVASSLVDMYSKCGSINDARHVFHKMSQRNVASWNAMIAGNASHGHGEDSLILFNQMVQAGIIPDHITFTGVLSACAHAGMVCEGLKLFDCIKRDFHIIPSAEHYACVVDLLGRAGHLDEAHDIINNMPFEPNASICGALLAACRIYCNIEIGECMAEHLFELEPENAGNYLLLSNIYAGMGRWDDAAKVRKIMKDRGLKRMPGYSWIKVNNRVYTFLVGNKSYPQMQKIFSRLERLAGQMEEAVYVPDTISVLHDAEGGEKHHILCGHNEMLAIGFELINSSAGICL